MKIWKDYRISGTCEQQIVREYCKLMADLQ